MSLRDRKLILIFSLMTCVFIILMLRLFMLTVLEYDPSNRQLGFQNTINPRRADIVDKNGILVATDVPVKTLYLNRDLLENPEFVADSLAKILQLDRDILYGRLINENTKSRYILIRRHILPEEEKAVRSLPIASIVFEDDWLRYYPQDNLFSHVLGYVDADRNGIIGIEHHYDKKLAAFGEDSLKLTLDVRIQNALRDVLLKARETYKPGFLVGIISEIKTGNILAMVSLPDFNPNRPNDRTNTFNHATYGGYELGSVFKVFNYANGLELGVVNEKTIFNVSRDVNYGSFTAKDIDSIKRRKTLTIEQAFALSSNIAAVQVAKSIGVDRQLKFFENLGLLEKMLVDIDELSLPQQPRKWKEVNLMTMAYGYGLALSPLHILNASNAIVNDGVMITPRLSYDFRKQKKIRVVSTKTSRIMRTFFEAVVKNGTGILARVRGCNVGGKTGTARKISNGAYQKGEHLVSFVGAFPMDDPRYGLVVVADRPLGISEKSGDGTGSSVAARIVGNVVLEIVPFLEF